MLKTNFATIGIGPLLLAGLVGNRGRFAEDFADLAAREAAPVNLQNRGTCAVARTTGAAGTPERVHVPGARVHETAKRRPFVL